MTTRSQPAAGVAVQVTGLRMEFAGRAVLDGLDLTLAEGESVAVVGPSGSGKTTVVTLLAGVDRPTGGSIRIADRDVGDMSERARAALRLREIGVVYQFGELLPELTPVENVALPALLAATGRAAAFRRAEELLAELGIGGAAEAPSAALSGGERQRVAVARALVNRPSLLLADEPTGSLDSDATGTVADLLFSQPPTRGCTMLVVTHDEQVAARADRITTLVNGRLVELAR